MAKFRATTFTLASRTGPPGKQIMSAVGREIATKVRSRTRSGLSEDNTVFAPYAPSTLKRKGYSRVDLTGARRGGMLDSLEVVEATDKSVRVGWTERELELIASYHAHGTRRKSRGRKKGVRRALDGTTSGMPARPFLGIPKSWVTDALKQFYSYFRKS